MIRARTLLVNLIMTKSQQETLKTRTRTRKRKKTKTKMMTTKTLKAGSRLSSALRVKARSSLPKIIETAIKMKRKTSTCSTISLMQRGN
jgi:hypothetical protein